MQQTLWSNVADKLALCLKHGCSDPRPVHGLSLKLGCLCSTFLCNTLLYVYCNKSSVTDAHKLFDEMRQPNVVSWSVMISGYVHQVGGLRDGVRLFNMMQERDLFPNAFCFGSLLTGCVQGRDLILAVQLHCGVVKIGIECSAYIVSPLIDMYAKCGVVIESWRVFNLIADKDVVVWTTMITCLANSGRRCFGNDAFQLFKDMVCSGVQPVVMTFASLVKVFYDPRQLSQAKQAHGCMVKLGIEVDDLLGSALIAMYGRCGGLDEVIRLSDRINHDVVSQTSLLVAYMQNGLNTAAINIFREMISSKSSMDPFCIASIVRACSELQELRMGKEIHSYTFRNGFMSDISVCNAVITFYGRCGTIRQAETVFGLMMERDAISWTALLTSYGHNGYAGEVVFLFQRMLREAEKLPTYSVTGAVSACSTMPSLSTGEQIHSVTVKMGVDEDLSIGNSLITMYARCGVIDNAIKVFSFMERRDAISWNALINGFSQHGFEKEALEVFGQMQKEGVQPDDLTFVGLLVSCSRSGLIAEGCRFFNLMSEGYGLEPKMEHYACMVDLFGRAGKLGEAMEFINTMPCDANQLVWEALLASCKVHENVELAKLAALKILQIKPEEVSPYIAISGIHASEGMWEGKACMRDLMKDHGAQKKPGTSWVEGPLF